MVSNDVLEPAADERQDVSSSTEREILAYLDKDFVREV
jgi:hypothetical protein